MKLRNYTLFFRNFQNERKALDEDFNAGKIALVNRGNLL